jgi:hypothetical protein
MKDYLTELVELNTGSIVSATIKTELSLQTLLEVEAVWGPLRIEAVQRMLQAGRTFDELPEHYHWNWARKLQGYREQRHRFVGVECAGEIQGLMRLDIVSQVARLMLHERLPLVYVDFLESAPWNAKQFTNAPRYKMTGVRLMMAAIRYSFDLGCEGRVGLHSLPQAREFYESMFRMTPLGNDVDHEGLMYYELSGEIAKSLEIGN